jgi:hypothetical protein
MTLLEELCASPEQVVIVNTVPTTGTANELIE